jgi:hypothetical protein
MQIADVTSLERPNPPAGRLSLVSYNVHSRLTRWRFELLLICGHKLQRPIRDELLVDKPNREKFRPDRDDLSVVFLPIHETFIPDPLVCAVPLMRAGHSLGVAYFDLREPA